eukprot:287439_1
MTHFEQSMQNDANKMFHFYPILLNELKQKIKDKYLNEFENINAKKHLADLHNKTVLTLYKEANDAIIQYTNPTQTMRDIHLTKINQTFTNQIDILNQQIAIAEQKRNQLIAQIEHKKKALCQ